MADEYEEVTGGTFWKPEDEGDSIEGKLKGSRETETGTIYEIENKDGTISLPSWAYLVNRLASIPVGRIVKIVFEGEEPPKIKGHHPTKVVKVFVKK